MEDYNTGAVRVVGGIEVPPTDKRGWRTLVLPNGMRVVLISDPVCDMAAASLAVGVGSLHDPIQGDTRLHGVSKPARSRVGHAAAAAARSALTACHTRLPAPAPAPMHAPHDHTLPSYFAAVALPGAPFVYGVQGVPVRERVFRVHLAR